MSSVVLFTRLVLATVFAVAAVAKLLDLPGSRRALTDFGVSERLSAPGGLLLPLAELGVATALLVAPSARWGAAAAGVLLLVFVGAIARALSKGRQADCHCFGELHSAPAGRTAIARNVVLLALAGLVLGWGPGPSVNAWAASRPVAEPLAWGFGLLAAVAASIAVSLWLENRRLRSAPAAVPAAPRPAVKLHVDDPAPVFTLAAVTGDAVSLGALCARRNPVALVFVDSHCGPCQALLPELGRWQTVLEDRLTIAFVSAGDDDRNRALAEEHGLRDVLLQQGSEVREAYGSDATPSAVIISPHGTIASELANGGAAIESLVRLELARARVAA
jgi:peroxiredoxin